jgi:dolichol-phosphate mannosyltransferase
MEYMGILFAAGAFTWGIVILVLNIIKRSYPTGWTAMMLVILLSSGLIMLSLGILGEYIWRTLDVAQNRPVYFVEEDVMENDKDSTIHKTNKD